MRLTLRLVIAVLVGTLCLGLGAPAYAAQTDLRAIAYAARGQVPGETAVPLLIYNLTAEPVASGAITADYVAPVGTSIRGVATESNGIDFTGCRWVQPAVHLRCKVQPVLKTKLSFKLRLRILRKVTSPGRYTISCACDTRTINNSVLVVVNGVRKPVASTTLSASPSTKPSARPSASSTPSGAEPSDAAGDFGSPAAAMPSGQLVGQSAADGSGTNVVRLLGFGIVGVGLLAIGGLVWRSRRRPSDEDDGAGEVEA